MEVVLTMDVVMMQILQRILSRVGDGLLLQPFLSMLRMLCSRFAPVR